ncbi:MAG: hypothetical protein WC974_08600 [Thermoplasmata archaeon]
MSIDRETLDLESFDAGIISRADAIDIPDNAATTSTNVDGDAILGRLKGVLVYTTVTITGAADLSTFKRGAWITTTDGKWNLVYASGAASDTLEIATDFYGTPTAYGTPATTPAYSFATDIQGCHVACGTANEPKWAGYINYDQFIAVGGGGYAVTGWTIQNAKIPKMQSAAGDIYITDAAITSAASMAFDNAFTYYYKLSAIYDYVQETPLGAVTDAYSPSVQGDATSITVSIKADTAASVNPRITGIKLYRQDYPVDSTIAPSLWRLVAVKQIADTTWTASVGDYTTTIVDDNTFSSGGTTYEQESGIAETVTSTDLKYTLNTISGGYHYVANCNKSEIPTANLMLFRSLAYRFDSFNWSQIGDFLRLPNILTALVTFNGRIWAFESNRMHRINPDLMVIEDTTEGIGCSSQRSVVVTDYGMFWCDYKNAYRHDGEGIKPIGEVIRSATGAWHGFSTNHTVGSQEYAPAVVFDSKRNTIMFCVPYYDATGTMSVKTFHVVRERWDSIASIIANNSTYTGVFVGANGDVYSGRGDGSTLYWLLNGSTTMAWDWTSKKFTLSDASQNKRFYEVEVKSSGTVTTTCSLDGGSFAALSPPINAKTIQIKFAGAADSYVDEASIMFRRLEGKR